MNLHSRALSTQRTGIFATELTSCGKPLTLFATMVGLLAGVNLLGATPAAVPVASPAAGSYNTPQAVTLTDSTPGAVIHYTVNGRFPNGSSPSYTGPFTVTSSAEVQAIAIAPGGSASPGADITYTFPAASPVLSPAPGTYSSSQRVTMSASTPAAKIYYTTDGSTPSQGSTYYTGPTTVSGTGQIRAVTYAHAFDPSPMVSAAYTISAAAAAPRLSPGTGSYTSVQTLNISDATPGATIYYTTDGSTPTSGSTPYTSPVFIGSSKTVKAVALANGYAASSVSTASYTLNLPLSTPVITPAAGTYHTAQSISISEAMSGATIYYTTDGSQPTTSSPRYTKPVLATADITIRALAVAPDGTKSSVPYSRFIIYPIAAATPVFPENGGKYTSVQIATITDATPGAAIYYTTDGTKPTTSSQRYTGPIAVSSTETIQALAIAAGTGLTPVPSSISSLYYYIVLPTAIPIISPAGGTYSRIQTVTITDATPGAVIYYELGGHYPSTSSPVYRGPISAPDGTIVRTLALAPKDSISNSVEATYNVVASAPSISPSAGNFTTSATVSMSDATPGSTIYYTTNGSIPNSSSSVYKGPFTVTPNLGSTQTFRAIAVSNGYQDSGVTQAQFDIDLPGGVLATALVSTTPKLTIPPSFLGIGHDLTTATQIIGQNSNGYNAAYRTLLENLTKNLTGPLTIRINGDESTLPAVQSATEPLSNLAQAVNVRLLLGVDMYSNNPSLAESEAAAYANGVPNQYIDAIELGNEPDNYYLNKFHSSTYSLSDYVADANTWDQHINSGTGGRLPIMEASYAGLVWVPGTQSDIAGGSFKPPIVSQHYYVTGESANPNIPADILLQPNSATAGPLKYAAFAATAHKAGMTFRMGELNSIWGGGVAGISNSFSSTLWSIDTSFEYLNNGMDGVNWYSCNYSNYQLFEVKSRVYEGQTYFTLNFVTPLYYGLLAFSEVAGHGAKLLPVTSSTTANVKIWATVDNTSTVHVVVINKDESATGNVQITLPGFTSGTVRYLKAASYKSTSGVTLGGQTFDGTTDGTIKGSLVTSTITANKGVFTLTGLPVTTAAIIDFAP